MARPGLHPGRRGAKLGPLREALQERFLGAPAPSIACANAPIAAVGLQQPGLRIVGQVALERFLNDALAQAAIFDGEAGFHAAEEVAIHPVGAGQVKQLFLVAIFKVENARVLPATAMLLAMISVLTLLPALILIIKPFGKSA